MNLPLTGKLHIEGGRYTAKFDRIDEEGRILGAKPGDLGCNRR
jgi:hypothetical protein